MFTPILDSAGRRPLYEQLYRYIRDEIEGGRLRAGELSVSRGVLFQTTRRMPTRFISGVTRVETPLLRRLHASLVVVHSPAGTLLLPGLDADDARRLESALTGGRL